MAKRKFAELLRVVDVPEDGTIQDIAAVRLLLRLPCLISWFLAWMQKHGITIPRGGTLYNFMQGSFFSHECYRCLLLAEQERKRVSGQEDRHFAQVDRRRLHGRVGSRGAETRCWRC